MSHMYMYMYVHVHVDDRAFIELWTDAYLELWVEVIRVTVEHVQVVDVAFAALALIHLLHLDGDVTLGGGVHLGVVL